MSLVGRLPVHVTAVEFTTTPVGLRRRPCQPTSGVCQFDRTSQVSTVLPIVIKTSIVAAICCLGERMWGNEDIEDSGAPIMVKYSATAAGRYLQDDGEIDLEFGTDVDLWSFLSKTSFSWSLINESRLVCNWIGLMVSIKCVSRRANTLTRTAVCGTGTCV